MMHKEKLTFIINKAVNNVILELSLILKSVKLIEMRASYSNIHNNNKILM